MYDYHNHNLPKSLLNLFVANNDIYTHYTRHSNDPHIRGRRTFQAGQSITHSGPHLWNTLPINIKELPKKHLFVNCKLFIENYWKLIFSNVVYFRLSLSIIWNNFLYICPQIYYIWRILNMVVSLITSPPEGVARYCFHPVCLSVCVCVYVSVCVCVRPIFWYFIYRLLEEISIWNLCRIFIGWHSIHWKNIDLHRSMVKVTETVHCFLKVQSYHKNWALEKFQFFFIDTS